MRAIEMEIGAVERGIEFKCTKPAKASEVRLIKLIGLVIDELSSCFLSREITKQRFKAKQKKHIAIYIAHTTFGISMRKIALSVGQNHSSIAYACRRVEEKRDETFFDDFISKVERLVKLLELKF